MLGLLGFGLAGLGSPAVGSKLTADARTPATIWAFALGLAGVR